MRKSLLSHIEKEELENLYQNHTEEQVAKKYEVSRSCVRNRLRQLGIPTKGRGGHWWPKNLPLEKLLDLYYNQKIPLQEIEKTYHICHKRLYHRLEKLNKPRRDLFKEIDRDQLEFYYLGCEFTMVDIASLFGVSSSVIKTRLEKLGIEIRPPHYYDYYIKKPQIGERRKNYLGYIDVYMPDHLNSNNGGWILEHRLIMSQYLGRPLDKNEDVHHRNGIRDDNRLENLELWASKHPRGQRVEDLIGYAKKILKKYDPNSLR